TNRDPFEAKHRLSESNDKERDMMSAQAAHEPAGADHWIDPAADRIADLARAAFQRLAQSMPEECGELRFALPGCDLNVRYVGHKVAAALTAAFEHLARGESSADSMQLNW